MLREPRGQYSTPSNVGGLEDFPEEATCRAGRIHRRTPGRQAGLEAGNGGRMHIDREAPEISGNCK